MTEHEMELTITPSNSEARGLLTEYHQAVNAALKVWGNLVLASGYENLPKFTRRDLNRSKALLANAHNEVNSAIRETWRAHGEHMTPTQALIEQHGVEDKWDRIIRREGEAEAQKLLDALADGTVEIRYLDEGKVLDEEAVPYYGQDDPLDLEQMNESEERMQEAFFDEDEAMESEVQVALDEAEDDLERGI